MTSYPLPDCCPSATVQPKISARYVAIFHSMEVKRYQRDRSRLKDFPGQDRPRDWLVTSIGVLRKNGGPFDGVETLYQPTGM